MNVLQSLHRTQSVLPSIVLIVGGMVASVPAAFAQCEPSWKVDEIGYAYHDAFINGLWQRVYRQPRRQAVAWEVSRHLPNIGLPATRDVRGASGFDAFGRRWYRDALGYAYYETGCGGGIVREYYQPERQSIAAAMHRQLSQLDWEGSVRLGVAGAMVRGFNATDIAGIDDATLRSVVGEQIIEGLNLAAEDTQSGNLLRFQELVAGGVEDAIVQAFNQMEVIGDGQPAANIHGESVDFLDQPPAMVAPADVDDPAADGNDAAADGNDAPSLSGNVSYVPANPENAGLIARHYAGGHNSTSFVQRYAETRFVDAGWVIGSFGTRPLVGGGTLVLTLQGDTGKVEVWRDGILVYSDCHYAEYFEDAQQIALRLSKN